MAQSGYTPLLVYGSSTAAAEPTAPNLTSSANGAELALNYADGKLFYKNSGGNVRLLAIGYGASTVTPTAGGIQYGTGTAVAFTAAGTAGYILQSNGTSAPSWVAAPSTSPGGSTTQVQYNNAGAFAGSANFVFDGTNVGIGTSSPTQKLHVESTTNAQGLFKTTGAGGGSNRSAVILQGPSNTWYINTNGSDLNGSDGALGFYGNSATRMVIDSSGNLGLGVTPSAWGASFKALQISGNGMAGTNSQFQISQNSWSEGSNIWRYLNTAAASRYEQASGVHAWYTAPSGTAGNTISFTQAMTLDASGKLGIGVTNPSALLDVRGSAPYMYVSDTVGANKAAFVAEATNTSVNVGSTYLGTAAVPLALVVGGTERARIATSGGFSVGTTADPGAGAIYATGAITAFYSDRRLKDVKGTITDALDKVSNLSGVYYTNNEVAVAHGYTSAETQVGLLAQDVEAVLPEVVKAAPFDLDEKGNSKSGEHYKTIHYERVIPLLVEAIKELRAEIQALRG